MKSLKIFIYLTLSLIGTSIALPTLASPTLEWVDQFGTIDHESGREVSLDGMGNLYVSGTTGGSLGGTNAGESDAYLSKYNVNGTLLWTKQLGTSSYDESRGVSADGLGNVYISGTTWGDLGGTNAGKGDAYVSKYDDNGSLLWTKQFGTNLTETNYGVSADGLGNVFISGSTVGSLVGTNFGKNDAFLSRFDASGSLIWTNQLGTTESDKSFSVTSDGLGNAYISGSTHGNLDGFSAGGLDAFVSKYNSSGTHLWTRQLGTEHADESTDISADESGNIYITGVTEGNLEGTLKGFQDAFLSKYDANGNLLWTQQIGSDDNDGSYSVSADGIASVYISGATWGSMEGSNLGSADSFVSKFSTDGTHHWTEQFGTIKHDVNLGLEADGFGNLYLSGGTQGDFGESNAGGNDGYLAKFVVPEPSSLLLVVLASTVMLMWHRR